MMRRLIQAFRCFFGVHIWGEWCQPFPWRHTFNPMTGISTPSRERVQVRVCDSCKSTERRYV